MIFKKSFRFITLVENSSLERKLIQGYVKRLRIEYLLKNSDITCEGRFIPLNFISSHFDKLSQMVGDGNFYTGGQSKDICKTIYAGDLTVSQAQYVVW